MKTVYRRSYPFNDPRLERTLERLREHDIWFEVEDFEYLDGAGEHLITVYDYPVNSFRFINHLNFIRIEIDDCNT